MDRINMMMKPRERGQDGQAVYSFRWETVKRRFGQAVQYALTFFAVVFCMAAGAACYRQYEVLLQRGGAQAGQQCCTGTAVFCTAAGVQEELLSAAASQPDTEGDMMPEEELEEELYYDSLELLACCVEAEAGNQGLIGKRLVVDVVLNRVDDRDFPDNIWDVITQPYQFTTYWNGATDRVVPSEETYEAVRMELEQRSYPGIYYFSSDGWPEYGTPWRQVGDHYFSCK